MQEENRKGQFCTSSGQITLFFQPYSWILIKSRCNSNRSESEHLAHCSKHNVYLLYLTNIMSEPVNLFQED